MGAGLRASIAHTVYRVLRVDPPDLPEAVLRASTILLTALAIVMWLGGEIRGHGVMPAADLALDTIALGVSGSLALLAWVRLRERGEPIALYHASAFLAMAIAYSVGLAISLERSRLPTLADPEASQVYVYSVARFLAALLLVGAGLARWPVFTRAGSIAVLLLPATIVLAVALAGPRLGGGGIPVLIIAEPAASELPHVTLLGALVQVATAVLFFVAAYLCRAAWQRQHAVFDAWVAVGLLFAGFAEIVWAQYPSGHPGQVSAADALRLAFFLALLAGVEAEATAVMRRMRSANVELARLREADVERAALEERARLARELHDGLAQDLWLAKLRAGELAALPDLSPEARKAVLDTESAIDDGLAEARGAVYALRVAAAPAKGFRSVLWQTAEDFEDRYGIRTEFTADGSTVTVAPRTQAELLRIVQEALANVRRHADATVVRIGLTVDGAWLELRIDDNGRGFEVGRGGRDWYGLASMHERATLVGGQLVVESAPGDGTHVWLRAPATPEAAIQAGAAP